MGASVTMEVNEFFIVDYIPFYSSINCYLLSPSIYVLHRGRVRLNVSFSVSFPWDLKPFSCICSAMTTDNWRILQNIYLIFPWKSSKKGGFLTSTVMKLSGIQTFKTFWHHDLLLNCKNKQTNKGFVIYIFTTIKHFLNKNKFLAVLAFPFLCSTFSVFQW